MLIVVPQRHFKNEDVTEKHALYTFIILLPKSIISYF